MSETKLEETEGSARQMAREARDLATKSRKLEAENKRLRKALAAFLPFAPGKYPSDPRSDDEIDAAKEAAFSNATKVLRPNAMFSGPRQHGD